MIVIISLLAAISTVGVRRAKEMARQTDCMSNLRQIGVALVAYRGDHGGQNPDWISNLYPTYVDDLSIYVCRSDENLGRGPTRPSGLIGEGAGSSSKYNETIDNAFKRTAGQNADVGANSYMYEFSCAKCSWAYPGNNNPTWAEYKEYELREGNNGNPHSSSRMPIVRCFHHALHSSVLSYPQTSTGAPNRDAKTSKSGLTINVAYAGNVVVAPLWWQGAVNIGDQKKNDVK